MSVKIRPFRNGGWELDIRVQLPDRRLLRERVKAPTASKSAALRWGDARERDLLLNGKPEKQKVEVIDVPKLKDFAERFLDDARANQQKPSAVAAKSMILRVHLIPQLGELALNAITTEDVQRLKARLTGKAAKTVNNILTVLSVLLKTAVEWEVLKQVPCRIKLLKSAKASAGFYDFDQYEGLVEAASVEGHDSLLIALLGGDAGLRCGEMIALEWRDVDLGKRQLCVERSDWNGQVTVPKGGRLRYVPLTVRLAAALQEHRHLRSALVLCEKDGTALTRQQVQYRLKRASNRAKVRNGVHLLRHTFCSHLAMRGAPARAIQELAGHSDLATTQRYMHLSPAALDAAIRLLDQPNGITPPARNARARGDMLETGTGG